MAEVSAGLLLYRVKEGRPEVLLVHPGGPYWAKRQTGAWSIPKGAVEEGEDKLAAARREFLEETGLDVVGPFEPLSPVKYRGGKTVHAWAVEGDCEPGDLRSMTFEIEWPPRSGRRVEFPEIDAAAFHTLEAARGFILPAQAPLLDQLEVLLRRRT